MTSSCETENDLCSFARPFPVRVECYAGYRGEETPRRFTLGRRQVSVSEVVDRWLAPDHRYFKLRGDDGGVYILRQDGESLEWEMVFYADETAGA